MLNASDLEGTIVAAITPFKQNGDVDTDSLYAHCTDLIQNADIAGIATGLNSETPSLRSKDKADVRTVMRQLKRQYPSIHIIEGIMQPTRNDVLNEAESMEPDTVSTVLLAPPLEESIKQGKMSEFIEKVHDKLGGDIGMIYYNTGLVDYKMTAEELERTHDKIGNRFIGVKCSKKDNGLIDDIVRRAPHSKPTYAIIQGNDRLLNDTLTKLELLREADKYAFKNINISGSSNVREFAQLIKCLYEAVDQQNYKLAENIQSYLTNSFDVVLSNAGNYLKKGARSSGEPAVWKIMAAAHTDSIKPYVHSPLIAVSDRQEIERLQHQVGIIKNKVEYFRKKLVKA